MDICTWKRKEDNEEIPRNPKKERKLNKEEETIPIWEDSAASAPADSLADPIDLIAIYFSCYSSHPILHFFGHHLIRAEDARFGAGVGTTIQRQRI
jgi:hypothetical protein